MSGYSLRGPEMLNEVYIYIYIYIYIERERERERVAESSGTMAV
jgi:hypothetical protein